MRTAIICSTSRPSPTRDNAEKKNLDPEKEAELQKEPKEKGDVPAMLLAAFLNLFLPAVIALLIFAGLIWLVFR